MSNQSYTNGFYDSFYNSQSNRQVGAPAVKVTGIRHQFGTIGRIRNKYEESLQYGERNPTVGSDQYRVKCESQSCGRSNSKFEPY